MGMRKYKRAVAKAFMRDVGVGNVNRKFSKERGGVKLWRLALKEHANVCKVNKSKEKQMKARKRIIRKAAQA